MQTKHTKNEAEKIIKRFDYLAKLIAKYAHRWGVDPSPRLCGWVDEYNNLRSSHVDIFNLYCERYGLAKDHNGHDCLA